MNKRMLLLVGCVCLAFSVAALGEDKAPDKAQAVIKKAESVKSYHQNSKMSMNMMGNQMEITGEMWVHDGKMRMEMTMPPGNMKQIIVSDGALTYTYMPAMNMVQKMDMKKIREALGADAAKKIGGPVAGNDADPFQGLDKSSITYVGSEELNGEKVDVIEGAVAADKDAMKDMPMMPEKARYWVATSDGMPRKMVFFGKDGQEMLSQEFSNVTVDPKMDESLFVFKAPEGAQVMDMTDGVINMYNEMQKGSAPAMPPVAPPPPPAPAGK
jgi:outer membrane lipoprotein-sorting protein